MKERVRTVFAFLNMQICSWNHGEMGWTPFERSANTYTGRWSRGPTSAGYRQYLPPRRYCHWREQTTKVVWYEQTSRSYIIQQHWHSNYVRSLDATFSCWRVLPRVCSWWRTLASALGTQLTAALAAAGFQTRNSRSLKALVDKHQWQRSWFFRGYSLLLQICIWSGLLRWYTQLFQ